MTAVMDADPARLEAVSRAFGADPYQEAGSLIGATDVDAVIIASPDETHAALALECIAAGKPVLCEKPLAATPAEARVVVEAEAAADRRLVQVGFMRHFDPQHLAVKGAIERGEIGRPVYFRGWHRNRALAPFPTTREVMISSAIHDLYSARWLLDAEIAEISVMGAPIDPDRSAELELQIISLQMTNGALAVIEVNRDSSSGYEVGVEVVGSDGTVTIAPHHTPPVRRRSAIAQREEPGWLERFAEAYVLEARGWVESMQEGSSGGPTAWDGYATLAAAEAGVTAIAAGPQRVELGERPR